MRAQRRALVQVTLIHGAPTLDRLGNATGDGVTRTVVWAAFEPQQEIVERHGNDVQPVMQPAVYNLAGVYDVGADDLIQEGADPDGTASDPVLWYVTGGGRVYLDRTKVPVTQTRSV